MGLNEYSGKIHVLASVLKQFLRDLKEPILSKGIAQEIVSTRGNYTLVLLLQHHIHTFAD